MSPARAPGRVKARDCLLSSRSHAPGPGGVDAQKNHTAGAGPQREACVSEKGWEGCVSGRVLKKRSAAKVWVRSARGVTSQETRAGVGHTVPTRKTRELFAVSLHTHPAALHPSPQTSCQRWRPQPSAPRRLPSHLRAAGSPCTPQCRTTPPPSMPTLGALPLASRAKPRC